MYADGRRMHPEPEPDRDFQRARPKPGVRRARAVSVAFLDMQCTRDWPPICPAWLLVVPFLLKIALHLVQGLSRELFFTEIRIFDISILNFE